MSNKQFLDSIKKIHFIGIGGISMSGLALILLSKGFNISGSDQKNSDLIESLKVKDANIIIGQKKENIHKDYDLVVYTAAINEDNEELISAKSHNITTITRAELLGQIMRDYPLSIGVAGTHGKTSTTSMIAHILISAKTDPTILVGGMLNLIDGNIKIGFSEYFATEACEYTNSFLHFHPKIGIIQNVEEDHLDFFTDITDIRKSFSAYINNINPGGYIIINSDIPDYMQLIKNYDANLITFSACDRNANYYAGDIKFDENGYANYNLYVNQTFTQKIELGTKGYHNVSNSLSSIASCRSLDLDYKYILKGLKEFTGTKRRYEYKGSIKNIAIIDDYAHHPTAIKTTLETALSSKSNKVWVIFQPHTYTRTYSFLEDFAKALSLADGIVLTDIYAAREPNDHVVHSTDLLKALKNYNSNSYYFSSFDDIEIFILQHLEPNDTLITMGAGDVYLIGEDLLR